MDRRKPHILGNCKKDHEFVLKDGKKLTSMYDLAMAMETMDSGVYSHHVNDSKNDFSTWIKDVYQNGELAENVLKAQNRIEMQLHILKALVSSVRR